MKRSAAAAVLAIALYGFMATGCSAADPVDAPASSSAGLATIRTSSLTTLTAGTGTASQSAAGSAVERVSPLAAGRDITCGGTLLSTSSLALPGGAENENTPASQALHAFIRNNPGGFLTVETSRNWSLMFASPVRAIFGHKVGVVGVDNVVSFTRSNDGAFAIDASTGCSGPIPAAGRTSAPVVYANVSGSTVVLHWLNSACASDAPPDKVLVKVEQIVVTGRVHLLVVVRSNPAVPAGPQSCGGVAVDSTATTTLKSGIDTQRIYDDYGIPASLISIHE